MVSAAALLLLAASALAEPAVEIRLDAQTIHTGHTVGTSVIVVGPYRRLQRPTVEVPDHVALSSAGEQRGITDVDGLPVQYTKWRFSLTGRTAGTWTIGPAGLTALDDEGKPVTLSAPPVELKVRQSPRSALAEAELQATARFPGPTAFEGQVIVYEYALSARPEVVSTQWFGHPWEALVPPREGRSEREQYEETDEQETIHVDRTWQPLVATVVGRHDRPAAGVQVEILRSEIGRGTFSGRGTQTIPVMAEPTILEIVPLPTPPADFSGLVGDFDIQTRLSESEITAGSSVTWTIDISGDGALDGYSLPAPEPTDEVRIYDGEVTPRAIVRSGRYRAFVTFERTVVPLRPGPLELPELTVTAFSPREERYVRLRANTAPLTVLAGDDTEPSLTSFGTPAPRPAEDGLRDIRRRGPVHAPAWTPALAFLGLAAAGPGLWTLLGVARQRWAQRRAARQAPPDRAPRPDFDALPTDPAARDATLDRVLRAALSAHLGLAPSDLDRHAALDALPPDVAEVVRAAMAVLDRSRFASDGQLDPTASVRRAVDALEPR